MSEDVFEGLARLQETSAEARRELVLKAYSRPELKANFDLYDQFEDTPDWSGIVREADCSVCSEHYTGRGRRYSLRICNPCLEVHVSIRDTEISRAEQELDIPLRVHGCFGSSGTA